ncbi:MAG: endo-1,4-beta-xylanase, partial [Planctomycetaceae bacterium]|nr:endo-1,4-beta-xylanase [Planctomycetaceae bacterium]
MGLLRFLVYPEGLIGRWPEVHRAYISGFDGRIYPTRVEIADNVITCRRPHSDSGKLHVPWPVPKFGRPVLSTTSLREREEPYLLPLELARGKLATLREQCAAWEMLNMEIPRQCREVEREAFGLLSRAAATGAAPPEASAIAAQSIARACEASELLVNAYVEQRLAMRRHSGVHPAVLLGCTLDDGVPGAAAATLFEQSFNAAVAPLEWRTIEPTEGDCRWESLDRLVSWCTDRRLLIRGGPLIDLGARGMPEWLSPWQNDFVNMQSFVCDFIETAVSRYTGRIRIWETSAHANTGVALGLTEENRLALAARALEAARRTDSDSQLFIRVDQPWSEYQARGQHRLSAFQFVDALVRSNVGLHGVNLEIAMGYRPRGSLLRDRLSLSRLVDVWSQLG